MYCPFIKDFNPIVVSIYYVHIPQYFNCTLKFCLTFQVLPSEKEMKQDLMNNAIYNEYNLEELETTFRYVSYYYDGSTILQCLVFLLMFPQINWKMLLGGLFPQPPQPHDVLIVHNPNYLRKLGRIISLFGKRLVALIDFHLITYSCDLKC